MHGTGASMHSSLTSRRWSKTLPIPQNRCTPRIIYSIYANKLKDAKLILTYRIKISWPAPSYKKKKN